MKKIEATLIPDMSKEVAKALSKAVVAKLRI